MKTFLLILSTACITLTSSSFTTIDSYRHSWKKLGVKTASFSADKDVLHVGLADGAFSKLKLHVTDGDLAVAKVVIQYAGGQSDHIVVKQQFRKGADSRVLDLNGNRRIIKNITFYYSTKNNSRCKAKVHVYGRR